VTGTSSDSASFVAQSQEEAMASGSNDNGREALGTFGEAARSKDKLPNTDVTPENKPKSGDLKAEQKDAADILKGNATGDKAKVDSAIEHEARTDKRSGA
jgi:hypothetical protein